MESNLRIGIENFGPISQGEIGLRPLTIFIGPNTSGKSYITMLIYSILESHNQTNTQTEIPPYIRTIIRNTFNEAMEPNLPVKGFLDINYDISSKPRDEELAGRFVKILINKIFEEVYESGLSDEIAYSFASPLDELVSIGKNSFSLKIDFNLNSVSLKNKDNILKIDASPIINIQLDKKMKDMLNILLSKQKEERKRRKKARQNSKDPIDNMIFIELIVSSMILISLDLFKDIYAPCYYLPAARSGLLQIHKGLIGSIVKKSSIFGTERPEIPRLAGVVSNFISTINNLPDKRTEFYDIITDFEYEMIKGEIVQRIGEGAMPEIKYIYKNTDIPLHRVSSTVSELAPIFLYLKYIIKKGNILIIEEPEAHLHPANQRLLAKLLVKLIRRGVKLIITTHSPYLLEQLSSFIMLSKIKPDMRVQRYKYDKNDYLLAADVGVYVFNPDRNDTYKVSNIDVTDEGIPQEEFTRIDEILYEETIRIQRDLSDFSFEL